MKTKPEGSTFLDNDVMTNLYHSIDRSVAEEPIGGSCFSQHSAWDFCRYVWWDGKEFNEEVWVYGSHVDTISESNLEDLMRAVNDKYGWN